MKNKKEIIGIIIISYRSHPSLSALLLSIKALRLPNETELQTVIVDGGTIPQSINILKKRFPDVMFITTQENLGVGKSFNKGITYGKSLGASYYLLLNADITVEKDYLVKLYNALTKKSKIGAVSGKILYDTKPPRILFIGGSLDPKIKSTIHIGTGEIDKKQYDSIKETELLNCPILIKADVIGKVGLFREDYFMYYEDTDYYYRMRKAGFMLQVEPSAIAYTDSPDEDEESFSVMKKHYYNARNLLYFISRNFSLAERLVAYAYIAKNTLPLVENFITNHKRKESYYKLLGMKDFIIGLKGMKDFRW